MFVDVGLLHSGANESHYAGEHAHGGADQLSRGPLLSGMFGTFPSPRLFTTRSARPTHSRCETCTLTGRR